MVTVRELTTQDVSRVARMFGKATRATQEQIAKEAANLSAMTLLLSLLEVEDDMQAWAADLIGVTVEEFKAMPASTILDIIDQLSAQDSARDFFARASRMAKAAWSKLSMQFSIATAGQTTKSADSVSAASGASAAS
ncbi:MAG: hypothetical protein M0R37_14515 [Bacteroidales bacterium]|jgi:hypothetical protein|nr:hypothetical protein [Sphaerochaeta sp.]MCK9629790.1 hypothetical protein [Bacteroidales bacterium]